jgi:small subunit ribosomal protein S35
MLDDEEFRALVIPGHTKVPEKKREIRQGRRPVPPPRYKSMPVDQDWTDVWPSAHTFKWSVVPFPVRQGYVERSENEGIPPAKYANAELMKIPNFLHLTPLHVKKHCAALKQYCNKWPEGLDTDEACDQHFPVQVTTRDYVADGASVRDSRARIVTVKVKLSLLDLDYHARDKFIRLAGERYNPETDMLSLEMDRCPVKKQNYDHAMYLITALYFESWKTESWESEKTLDDMEKYFWDINSSRSKILHLLKHRKQLADTRPESKAHLPTCLRQVTSNATDEQIVKLPEVVEYKTAISELLNDGENMATLERYKKAVKQLLLSPAAASTVA